MSCLLHQKKFPPATPPLPEQNIYSNSQIADAKNDLISFFDEIPFDDLTKNSVVSYLDYLYGHFGTSNGLEFLLDNYPDSSLRQHVVENCQFLLESLNKTMIPILEKYYLSPTATEGQRILAFKLLVSLLDPPALNNFLQQHPPMKTDSATFLGRWLPCFTPEVIAKLAPSTAENILQKLAKNKVDTYSSQLFLEKLLTAQIPLTPDFLIKFLEGSDFIEKAKAYFANDEPALFEQMLKELTPHNLPNFLPALIKHQLIAQTPLPITAETFGSFFERTSFVAPFQKLEWQVVLAYLNEPEQKELRQALTAELVNPHSQHAPTFGVLATKPVFEFLLQNVKTAADYQQLDDILKRKRLTLATKAALWLLSSQCLKNSGQVEKGELREKMYLRDIELCSPTYLAEQNLPPKPPTAPIPLRNFGSYQAYVATLAQIVKTDLRQNGSTHLSPKHLQEIVGWGVYAQDSELISLCPSPRSYTKDILLNVFNNLTIQPQFLTFLQQEMATELTTANQQGVLPPSDSLCALFFKHLAKQETEYQPEFKAVVEQLLPELTRLPNHPAYLKAIGNFGTPANLPELRKRIKTEQYLKWGGVKLELKEKEAIEALYKIRKRFNI